jgi:hypothetical protein
MYVLNSTVYSKKAFKILVILSLLLMPLFALEGNDRIATAQVNDSEYGAGSNPTGNPIGGGAGYTRLVTSWNYLVATKAELYSALANAISGETIYIDDSATLDLSAIRTDLPNGNPYLELKEGVTLASGRGKDLGNGVISNGGLIYSNDIKTKPLIRITGANVRITGLRIQGPDPNVGETRPVDEDRNIGIETFDFVPEIDNNEISAWSFAAIKIPDGNVHHNYIHHNQRTGLGYGVVLYTSNTANGVLIEANEFDYNRHSIAASGQATERYEARYNIVYENTTSSAFDMHAHTSCDCAGDHIKIHHNTFHLLKNANTGKLLRSFYIKGIPLTEAYVEYNWFYNSDAPYNVAQANEYGNMNVGTNKYGTGDNVTYQTGVYSETEIQ